MPADRIAPAEAHADARAHAARRGWSAEMLRVVAGYLVLILALQGVVLAHARGLGSLHRHTAPAPSAAAALFAHPGHDLHSRLHSHSHATGERHHHAATDATVVPTAAADDSADVLSWVLAAGVALTAALALRWPADRRRHVWRAAPPWACCVGLPDASFKPPRRR